MSAHWLTTWWGIVLCYLFGALFVFPLFWMAIMTPRRRQERAAEARLARAESCPRRTTVRRWTPEPEQADFFADVNRWNAADLDAMRQHPSWPREET